MSNTASLDDRATKHLLDAATWLVTHGFARSSERGVPALQADVFRKFIVQLWAGPSLAPSDYREGFRLKDRGFNVDLIVVSNARSVDQLQEYWVAKLSSMTWAPQVSACHFFVAVAKAQWGDRTIIHDSGRFIDVATMPQYTQLAIQDDDLATIYRLAPWKFPREYAGTALGRTRVTLGQDGRYRLAPGSGTNP